jgi:hypothetical protein
MKKYLLILVILASSSFGEVFEDSTDQGNSTSMVNLYAYAGFAIAPEAGTADYVGGWVQGPSGATAMTYNFLVYSNEGLVNDTLRPDTCMFVSSDQTCAGTYAIEKDSVPASFSFSANDTLWIGYRSSANPGYWRHDNSGTQANCRCQRSGYLGSLPSVGNAWSDGSASGCLDNIFSTYIQYTPSGGGGTPQIIWTSPPPGDWLFASGDTK